METVDKNIPLNYSYANDVSVCDPFWSPMLEKMSDVTLRDVWQKYDKEGALRNFKAVAEKKTGTPHCGTPWEDGMIYELIRAASDLFTNKYDPELDALIDTYIAAAAEAQKVSGDGYINTFTSMACPDNRFGQNGGFLIIQHDLYNAGCLFEAGVHHYKATGKKTLIKIAVDMANCICSEIGYPPKKNIVPAHSMIEQATVQLYRLMKEEPELAKELGGSADRYLELANFWMDYRGVHVGRVSYPKNYREYAQDHRPLREQDEALGHAVRAALLYEGMACVANETGDEGLYKASMKLWENVTETKMHVTGGIGVSKDDERFGFQYELPMNAYLETCAGVAFAFWAAELHRKFRSGRFFDIFECALYNNILGAVSEKGTEYTYVNPLQSDGSVNRWEWHGCPCCPPMLLKMMGSLKTYIYSYDSGNIWLNLHIGSRIKTDGFEAEYANSILTIKTAEQKPVAVHIRIPDYSRNFALKLNGEPVHAEITDGYASLTRIWAPSDRLEVSMEQPIERLEAHPYAWNNPYGLMSMSGRVAVRHGAVIYCAEGIDNDGKVDFVIKKDSALTLCDDGSIIGEKTDGGKFRLVPYYTWNNRGAGTMSIWLIQEGHVSDKKNLDGWDHKLYRAWKED